MIQDVGRYGHHLGDAHICHRAQTITTHATSHHHGEFMIHVVSPHTRILFTIGTLCIVCAPMWSAVNIDDGDLSINFGTDIQAQESTATAKDANGNSYDIINDRDGHSDQMNTQERRARFFLYGSYDKEWRYFLGYLVDNADNTDYKNSNRSAQIFKAWLERDIPTGAAETSTVHAGVDYPFYNIAIQGDPNWLFCNQRATGTLGNIRGVGLRYKLGGAHFTWGFDLMHNMDPAKPAAATGQKDGLFYSSRVELSLLPGTKPAYKESYAGAPGHSLLLAADVGYDDHDVGYYNTTAPVANYETGSLGFGFECLYHLNGLSALAEYRALNTTATGINAPTPATLRNRARIWLIQAGYTIPIDSMGIEPALRYSAINYGLGTEIASDYDATSGSLPSGSNNGVFGVNANDADSGLSGRQIDAGVNLYLRHHIIELQLDYSYWRAAYGQGRANILRLQEQIAF